MFISGVIILIVVGVIGVKEYIYKKNAKIEIVLQDDLTLEFNNTKKVSDFIVSLNGNIIDDYEVSFKKIGKKNIAFEFINDKNIKLKYDFDIEVIDTVKPLIWLNNSYSLEKDSETVLTDVILCGDNYDNKPNCFIEGEYDVHTVGSYPLVFKAIDNSGNEAEQAFTLHVYEPDNSSNNYTPEYTNFEDIIKEYKNENNQIGIDVSSWQGDIDFEKINNAGVEFIIIRVGTINNEGEHVLDKKFERNIKLANEYDIPVGLYFYSYADSIESAREDAKWVIEQIKDYKVDLPIAFDWEEWRYFNSYELSFFGLTSMAEAYLEEIEKAGYKGMLYSSKNYLEKIWFPTKYETWLAHYTDETNYSGEYTFWQMMSSGTVDGIRGGVDVNIYYPGK